MNRSNPSRRALLKLGAAAAGVNILQIAVPRSAWAHSNAEVIPWLDQPPPNPIPNVVGNLLQWEQLDSRITPAQDFFYVSHYGQPHVLDETAWRVDIAGLVARPQSLALADIKSYPRHQVEFTLECSGNTAIPFFIGGIGNARWAGARLADVLARAGVMDRGTEVVFWGTDRGTTTIRDNSGILTGGHAGAVQPDTDGGLDLTITEQFARSMSVEEAMAPENLLCYEMNGEPLPPEHGFPLRLIAPGWYGVANVKWLNRIEVLDHRYAGRFMARDYVSIREQQRNGETIWTFTTVSRARLKSAPAKVMRSGSRYTVMGAAWGARVAEVEVQVDAGPWLPARLDHRGPNRSRGHAWTFWTFDWGTPAAGEHSIRSRAFDTDGNVQPPAGDPFLASRVTYWENNGQITRRVMIA